MSRPDKIGGDDLQMPDWWHNRPLLCWDFCPTPEKYEKTLDVGQQSMKRQETGLVEDLLLCLNGIEGKHIKTPSLPLDNLNLKRTFHIDRSIHPSLRELAEHVIPICENYSMVMRYIDMFLVYGRCKTRQALASAMMKTMHTYFTFIGQLEASVVNEGLSLQQLHCRCEKIGLNLKTLSDIASMASVVDDSNRWHHVLDKLYMMHKQSKPDPINHQLIYDLCKMTYKPYLNALARWLNDGEGNDDEFGFGNLAMSSAFLNFEDDFFMIEQVPTTLFIPRSSKATIWRTGCFVNLIKQARTEAQTESLSGTESSVLRSFRDTMKPVHLEYSDKSQSIVNSLDEVFETVSNHVLDLFINHHKVMEKLDCIRSFFFLTNGDLLVQFLDTAAAELSKGMGTISLSRLQSLFDIATRMSSCNASEDVKLAFMDKDIISELEDIQAGNQTISGVLDETTAISESKLRMSMTAYQLLTLDYEIVWPLRLLITETSIKYMRLLFHHLFYLKHVERTLSSLIWPLKHCHRLYVNEQLAAIMSSADISDDWLTTAFTLRQRMLNFVQAVLSHASVSVLEPRWHNLLREVESMPTTKLSASSRLQHLAAQVNHMICGSFEDCLLSNTTLMRQMHKGLSVCALFCHQAKKTAGTSARMFSHRQMRRSNGGPLPSSGTLTPPPCRRGDEIRSKKLSRSGSSVSLASSSGHLNSSRSTGSGGGSPQQPRGMSWEEAFARHTSTYTQMFSKAMNAFIRALVTEQEGSTSTRGSVIASSLLLRLDFNHYYTGQEVSDI